MKLISWNVNGIKSCLQNITKCYNYKDLLSCDVLMLQEIRTNNFALLQQFANSLDMNIVYHKISDRSGYGGVAVFAKKQAIEIFTPSHIIPEEGRIIVLVYEDVVLVNLYVPYIGIGQSNLNKRISWERHILELVQYIKEEYKRKIIIGGDLNVAPSPQDRYRVPLTQPGCSYIESTMFTELIKESDLVDAFEASSSVRRGGNRFTWGVNQSRLRIDYFLVSKDIEIQDCYVIYDLHQINNNSNNYPSDHYPLVIETIPW